MSENTTTNIKSAEGPEAGFLDRMTSPIMGDVLESDVGLTAQLQRALTTPAALIGMGAAGLGGAGVLGYHASRADRPGETARERRRRILRDSITGGVMGAGAVGSGSIAGTAISRFKGEPGNWLEKLRATSRERSPLGAAGAVAGFGVGLYRRPAHLERATAAANARLANLLNLEPKAFAGGIRTAGGTSVMSPSASKKFIAKKLLGATDKPRWMPNWMRSGDANRQAHALFTLSQGSTPWSNPGSYFGRPARGIPRIPFAGPTLLGAAAGLAAPTVVDQIFRRAADWLK